MKLLLDQNISFRVSNKLLSQILDIYHVSDVGLLNAPDEEIWEFSKKENYAIITFDADFYDLQTLRGFPPKIIWLRFGNTTTEEMIGFINLPLKTISEFLGNDELKEIGCLEFHNLT